MHWTREVASAIRDKGVKGLREYGEKCTKQLAAIVGMARTSPPPPTSHTLS